MKKHILEITTAPPNLENVMAFIEKYIVRVDNLKAAQQLVIVVEELATNIFKYAYNGQQGKFTLSISINPEQRRIVIEFRDNGKKYNPLLRDDPDITEPIPSRKIGGLGIMISKKLTDEQYYTRKNEENVLIVVKNY